MPPTNPLLIADLAQALLTNVVQELLDPPAQQFRTIGQSPATHDCEHVAVRSTGGNRGLAGEELFGRLLCTDSWVATFAVEVVRCWPTPGASGTVDTAEIDAATVTLLTDSWSLMQGIHRATKAEEWVSACQSVTLGRLTPMDPQGGYHGVMLDVTAELF